MSSDPAVQALLDATDLAELIEAEMGRLGRPWAYRRRGDQARGACPFRENSDEGRFRVRGDTFVCFGDTDPRCAGSGDAITFLRHLHGWSYGQALERLSEFTKLPLPKRQGPLAPSAVRAGILRSLSRHLEPVAAPASWSAAARSGWDRAVAHRIAGRMPAPREMQAILLEAGATDEHLDAMRFPEHSRCLMSSPLAVADPGRAMRALDGPCLGRDDDSASGWAALRPDVGGGLFAYTVDPIAWLEWGGAGHGGALALNPLLWSDSVTLPHVAHRASDPVVLVDRNGPGRGNGARLGMWLAARAPRLRVVDARVHAAADVVANPSVGLPTYPEWMVQQWESRAAGDADTHRDRLRHMDQLLHAMGRSPERVLYSVWWARAQSRIARTTDSEDPTPRRVGVSSGVKVR